ncbi:MAG: tRNA lysidine(34) synthetase TilS [Thiolinea sp.]
MQPGELLLTAHHQDDQAETLLLNLLRGGGRGLAAMPERRALGAGWLGRPLLTFTRAELEAYARAEQLNWVDDPSNQQTDFDRNFLRHHILPPLKQRWPERHVHWPEPQPGRVNNSSYWTGFWPSGCHNWPEPSPVRCP